MGLPPNADCSRFEPIVDEGSWINDPESPGELLRPGFAKGFKENRHWHIRAVSSIRKLVPQLNPIFSVKYMKDMPENDIVERMGVVFKGISGRYRKFAKQKAVLARNGGTDGKMPEVAKVKNRRAQRKQRVSNSVYYISRTKSTYSQPRRNVQSVLPNDLQKWVQTGTSSFKLCIRALTRPTEVEL
jgi:hypothetical protein